MTFTGIGFQAHHWQTRRDRFPSAMDGVVPWREPCSLVEPRYPSGQRGRPPIGVERMPRIYFLQQCFNMSDPRAEDCLYDGTDDLAGFLEAVNSGLQEANRPLRF